jgi:hypothetical protein
MLVLNPFFRNNSIFAHNYLLFHIFCQYDSAWKEPTCIERMGLMSTLWVPNFIFLLLTDRFQTDTFWFDDKNQEKKCFLEIWHFPHGFTNDPFSYLFIFSNIALFYFDCEGRNTETWMIWKNNRINERRAICLELSDNNIDIWRAEYTIFLCWIWLKFLFYISFFMNHFHRRFPKQIFV